MGYGRGGYQGGNGGGRGGGGRGNGRQQYDNEMRGVLFRNKQQRNEKDPYYQGNCQVNGVKYWVSAWINEDDQGNKRINFNLTEAQERQGQRGGGGQGYNRQNRRNDNEGFDDHDRQRGQQRGRNDDPDDDIPY